MQVQQYARTYVPLNKIVNACFNLREITYTQAILNVILGISYIKIGLYAIN